jgi:hypothetical protein
LPIFFYGVFVRFSARGVQKHKKQIKKIMSKAFCKKKRGWGVGGGCRCVPTTCKSSKTPLKAFQKQKPENLKKQPQEKQAGLAFFFRLWRPLWVPIDAKGPPKRNR